MTDIAEQTTVEAPTLVTYITCTNATLDVLATKLTPAEGKWIQRILDRLTDIGVVTLASANARARQVDGADGIIRYMRATFGALVVDAAIGAAEYPASPLEPPHAIMPMTRFEADQPSDTELTAYGQLFGCDIQFKALALLDDGRPVTAVPSRLFDRWGAERSRQPLPAIRLPGRTKSYAVFAFPNTSDL